METKLERVTDSLCRDLFEQGRNSVLLYGRPDYALTILKDVYGRAKARDEFLCTWHDASAITKPMDFFEPILRLKYGDHYESLSENNWFKDSVSRNDKSGVFQLASLCGRENNTQDPNHRRTPVIFIDGIEELFFKMDFGHLNEDEVTKVMIAGSWERRPLPKGFGDCLRGYLHQTRDGIFYGAARNYESPQFQATLGNPGYLFYALNFMFRFLE